MIWVSILAIFSSPYRDPSIQVHRFILLSLTHMRITELRVHPPCIDGRISEVDFGGERSTP